jgi:hypothetical protein
MYHRGGRVRTRGQKKAQRKSMRRHMKSSKCRGKSVRQCQRAKKSCKVARGPKRTFCRTRRNTHTRVYRK